jgi:hypothetical protein
MHAYNIEKRSRISTTIFRRRIYKMSIAENRSAFRKYGAVDDDYVNWVKFPILAASFLVPPPLFLPTRYEA